MIKLLIIDDNAIILKLMKNVLDEKKFIIKTLNTADNIINEIKKIIPAIILLDIKLPNTTGEEAIRLIKKENCCKDIPIIAFTSYTMKGDKTKFLKMGYNGYIAKPIDTRANNGVFKKIEVDIIIEIILL